MAYFTVCRIDGCVVLAKDAMLLKAAWEEQYERKRIKAAKVNYTAAEIQ